MRSHATAALVLLALAAHPAAAQEARRAITLGDHSRLVAVADPQRSPEGERVACTVTTNDVEKDKRNTDVWIVKWDGSSRLPLTSSPDSESSPRWSPDGRYVAFVAPRGTEEEQKKGAQICCSTGAAARPASTRRCSSSTAGPMSRTSTSSAPSASSLSRTGTWC